MCTNQLKARWLSMASVLVGSRLRSSTLVIDFVRIGMPPQTAEGVIMVCAQLLSGHEELLHKTSEKLINGDYDYDASSFKLCLVRRYTWCAMDEGVAFAASNA